MKIFRGVFLNSLPVLLMLFLMYIVMDDYVLAGIFVVIIVVSLCVRYEKLDITALVLGIVIMTAGELLFIGSAVEIFTRASFLSVMPLWLPLLWGYSFVAIKRAVLLMRTQKALY